MAVTIPVVLWFSLLAVASADQWNTQDFMKREHSLIKPYQGGGFGIPNWDFLGSTMVTGSHIRLTPDAQSKFGALWNRIVSHTE